MAVARYLADTSALARLHLPSVAERLGPLAQHGLVATCSVVDLELLFSTRSPQDYVDVAAERRGFELLPTDQEDWDRAAEVQAELAKKSMTRAVGIPDLLVASVARRHRVIVLHYDRDFDVVTALTGQPVEWVVPAGSVP